MSKKMIIGLSLGFVLIVSLLFAFKKNNKVKADDNVKNDIKTVKIEEAKKGYEDVLMKKGIVKGKDEVYLSPKAEGRVSGVFVKEGDFVKKGQLLAKINGDEMATQLKVAEVGYSFADSMVGKTKDYFAKQVSQAKKAKDLAKDAYQSAKNSGDEESIAEAKANYEMAKKGYELAKEGYDLQVGMSRGKRDVAQAQMNAASIVTENNELRAPFSGVVGDVKISVGDLVSPQRPMFLLIGNGEKEVALSLSSSELKGLKVGQSVTVLADDGISGNGKILSISPMIDTYSRKGVVKVSLDNAQDFSLGVYVKVMLPKENGNEEISVIVPQNSLIRIYRDNFVFVVNNGKAEKRAVKIGKSFDGFIVIKDGVSAGEKVVVNGQQYLNDGEMVKIVD